MAQNVYEKTEYWEILADLIHDVNNLQNQYKVSYYTVLLCPMKSVVNCIHSQLLTIT